MKKDIIKILEEYKSILESENINNTFSTQASTKFTTDNMQKFIPITHDQADEEKKKLESQKLREKLKTGLTKLKSLIGVCESPKCTYKQISELIYLMENPEFKNDLNDYKTALQEEGMELGLNSGLAR